MINNSEEISLQSYFYEMNKIPLLTREQEEKLVDRMYYQGDLVAKNKLVESNLRFVVHIAKQYHGCGLSLEELISEGNGGLIKATEKFDPSKKNHFVTYAVWWIRQFMTKAIYKNTGATYIPINKVMGLNRIKKRLSQLEIDCSDSNKNIERVASEIKQNPEYVRLLLEASQESVSLEGLGYDPNQDGEESSYNMREIIQDRKVNVEEEVMDNVMRQDVLAFVSTLRKRDADILIDKYGLRNGIPKTLKEIGQEYNLSRERIRQICYTAIKKLSKSEKKVLVEDYL